MVLAGDSADAAADWIAEHISAVDVCVTSDIPLASRCLKKGARVVSPTDKHWTPANIGNALAGREIARHLRELGTNTRGPAPVDEERQVTVSWRTRYGLAGCIARGGAQLSQRSVTRSLPDATHLDRMVAGFPRAAVFNLREA
jgi:hypothetical protein